MTHLRTFGNTIKIRKESRDDSQVSKAVRKELTDGENWMLDIEDETGTRITSKKKGSIKNSAQNCTQATTR